MIIALAVLTAGLAIMLGADLWPLSVHIVRGYTDSIGLAMICCLLLARAVEQTTGLSRSLLATACMGLPLIPVHSPYGAIHQTAWILIILCGMAGLLYQNRSRAWLVAAMAWLLWLANFTHSGSLGGDSQAVIIAGIVFCMCVMTPVSRGPEPEQTPDIRLSPHASSLNPHSSPARPKG